MKTEINPIYRLPQVVIESGYKRASIYKKMNEGTFPKSIKLGARAVGWLKSDIDEWKASLIAKDVA